MNTMSLISGSGSIVGAVIVFLCVASILSMFVIGFGVFLFLRSSKKRAYAAQPDMTVLGAPLDLCDRSDIPVSDSALLVENQQWATPMPAPVRQQPPGSNYAAYRPTQDFEARYKGAFARISPLSWPERQVFDALYAWVWDDLNTRYGDRFTLLAKIPLNHLVKSKVETLPNELLKVMSREVDFVICARGHKLKPVLAITIWVGSSSQNDNALPLMPDQVVEHRDLTPQEWEQWIGAGLLQLAGIHSYLVTEKMALDWARVCRDFLSQLEGDIGDALKTSDVYGPE